MAAQGPLAGLKVLEVAGIGPGPFCAMVLADLGAEVLRVERPGSSSRDRRYDLLVRNRPAVELDLKVPEGAAAVLRLVEQADALLEGFRPGVVERLGVGPAECLARNPRLVYGRMTGWGQDGPWAERAGHDICYLGLAGALAHIGRAGELPTPPLNLVGDFGGGGMLLAVGLLAGLVHAQRTGRGQVVDAAMVDGTALLMAPFLGARAIGAWSDERGTNLLDSGSPYYDVYPCADDREIAVGAIEPQFFAALVRGLGLDPEELPHQHDRQRWPELREAIATALRTRPRDEWVEVLAPADACVAPVLTMGDAAEHPHISRRGTIVDVDGVPHPGPAPRFSATPAGPPSPGTLEEPDEALGPWGWSAADVEALRASGALG
jgi:alpha-methylacyl-CoA racemase